jgi:hypothetical protein
VLVVDRDENYSWPHVEAATMGSDDATGEVMAAYARRIGHVGRFETYQGHV